MCKNGKSKYASIARTVAKAFCEPKEGCNEVNHINECKDSNYAINLEWCDRKYNCNYGNRNKNISRPILQYSLDGYLFENGNLPAKHNAKLVQTKVP